MGGGFGHTASGALATIGGGWDNTADGDYTTIGGGVFNTATGQYSTVGGGLNNIASGDYATVPGGIENWAVGVGSFAAGQRAHANHYGSFVFADVAAAASLATTDGNQFLVRASGGVTMYTNPTATSGVSVLPGAGSWTMISDRNAKANFAPVDGWRCSTC